MIASLMFDIPLNWKKNKDWAIAFISSPLIWSVTNVESKRQQSWIDTFASSEKEENKKGTSSSPELQINKRIDYEDAK